MEWFREAFDQHYLTVYARRDAKEAKRQVAFLLNQLGLPVGAWVLDLGCGTGRHAVELSRRNFRVVCLDLSFVLLKLIEREENQSLWKLRADMRHLPIGKPFDAVVSFFTSFGYFDSSHDDLKVLREVVGSLRRGGAFFLDLPNPLHLRSTLIPYSEERRNGLILRQWRWYNPQTRRVEKQIVIQKKNGIRRVRESVRCYTLEEIRNLLLRAGLSVERVWGDFDGQPYGQSSPRILTLSRKLSEVAP